MIIHPSWSYDLFEMIKRSLSGAADAVTMLGSKFDADEATKRVLESLTYDLKTEECIPQLYEAFGSLFSRGMYIFLGE